MNNVLFDYLNDFCTAYLNDILIFSENIKDYEEYVRRVLLRLRKAGLQVDIKKYKFRTSCTKYLGYIVSTKGIGPDPDKVSVIKD